jgi:hypothetical protein
LSTIASQLRADALRGAALLVLREAERGEQRHQQRPGHDTAAHAIHLSFHDVRNALTAARVTRH